MKPAPVTKDTPPKGKLIVAGGRKYLGDYQAWKKLELLNPAEVVSGGCSGADEFGERWADCHDIKVLRFNAEWGVYGKRAGPVRNRQMAEYADAVILFPGGKGTQSMYNEAIKAGLEIHDYRNE